MPSLHPPLLTLLLLLPLLTTLTLQQNISMAAWVSPGYYYSHRCQVTIEITSNYFQSSYQLFHILAKNNAYFFNTVEYDNVFYIKGTNSMEAMMTSSETYCRFPMSTTYYCPFISVSGYDPYGIRYYQTVNTTHKRLTIRLARAICPAQGSRMSFRIQMPVSSDYSMFYMYVPSITDKAILTVDKLSFVYNQQVQVDLSNLSYKQVKQLSLMPQKYFIVNCKVNYSIAIKFQNLTYYDSWDQINIYLTNQQSLSLSGQCYSNLTSKPFSCLKTTYGYQLKNLNQTNMNKSYEIAEQEYYADESVWFGVWFAMQFVSAGSFGVEVVCKASGNGVQESALLINMTHNSSEVYGRAMGSVEAVEEGVFGRLASSANKYDPLKCMTPIVVSNQSSSTTTTNTTNTTTTTTNTTDTTSTNSTTTASNTTNQTTTTPSNSSTVTNSTTTTTNSTPTNNSTSNTTTNSTTNPTTNTTTTSNSTTNSSSNPTPITPTYTYTYSTTTGFQINQLLFLSLLLITLSLTLILSHSLPLLLKLLYLLSILLLSLSKLLFLLLAVDQTWLEGSSSDVQDSLMLTATTQAYSLELFVMRSTFVLQFGMNFIYFFSYLVILLCSKEIGGRIKKFYGTKFLNQAFGIEEGQPLKLTKCNFSSVLFTLVTFLTFLVSFKIYGVLIFKLQLNLECDDSNFRKYRLKNSVLYKTHTGHLAIDLLLEFNVLIWAFLLIKSSQNEVFTIGLYIFIGLYCIHAFLLARALKVFYLMAKKSDQFNRKERQKLKTTFSCIEGGQCLGQNEECEEKAQNIQHEENGQKDQKEKEDLPKVQRNDEEFIEFHMIESRKSIKSGSIIRPRFQK